MNSNGYIVTTNKEQVRDIDYTINKLSKLLKDIILKADSKDIETRLYLESLVDTIICEPIISHFRVFNDILTSDSIVTIISQDSSSKANLIVESELSDIFKEKPGTKKEGTKIYGKDNKVCYMINNKPYNLITRVAHANQGISMNMNRTSRRQSAIDINNILYKVIYKYYSIYKEDLDLLIASRFGKEIAIKEHYEYWNLKQLREIVDNELLNLNNLSKLCKPSEDETVLNQFLKSLKELQVIFANPYDTIIYKNARIKVIPAYKVMI